MSDPTPTSGQDTPIDPVGLFPDHAHHRRVEERLARLERRSEIVMLIVIFVVGAAMALGLAAASGHVTW
jgi:hypothetical protein